MRLFLTNVISYKLGKTNLSIFSTISILTSSAKSNLIRKFVLINLIILNLELCAKYLHFRVTRTLRKVYLVIYLDRKD